MGPPPWVRQRHHRRHPVGRLLHGGPLHRSAEGRLVAGVAASLSRRTGMEVGLVRVGLLIFGLASGAGVAAYVLAWLFLPIEGRPGTIAGRALSDARGLMLALAFLPVLVLSLLLGSVLGLGFLSAAAWPLFISPAGLVLIWRNADPEERQWLARTVTPLVRMTLGRAGSRLSLGLRLAGGMVLLLGGLGLLVLARPRAAGLRPVAGVLAVVAAFVLVFGPWWLGLARDLVEERQARARAEERADMAARVHDSVLQTLALIQRSAGDPQRVVTLARNQERELRSWLFEGRPPGAFGQEAETVAAGMEAIEREVEESHGVAVETVTVGDRPLDDRLHELLAAAREAAVNAAKWSGAPVVSMFAEVEPGGVTIFVRDRGRGFDPDAVAPDRRGLSESIRGRMARHGGTASVRTAPGAGTEVELVMPAAAEAGVAGA